MKYTYGNSGKICVCVDIRECVAYVCVCVCVCVCVLCVCVRESGCLGRFDKIID